MSRSVAFTAIHCLALSHFQRTRRVGAKPGKDYMMEISMPVLSTDPTLFPSFPVIQPPYCLFAAVSPLAAP